LASARLTLLQSTILSLFYIYALDISPWRAAFSSYCTSWCSRPSTPLTLGMLLSSLAHSEFQMMQFIPLVICADHILRVVPASGVGETVGKCIPLHYTASPCSRLCFHGAGFGDIGEDMAVSPVLPFSSPC
jgi:ABC-2 type transport system permease protein